MKWAISLKNTHSWKSVNKKKVTLNKPLLKNWNWIQFENLSQKKAPGPNSTAKFHLTHKAEMMPVLYTLFQDREEQRTLSNLFN